MCPTRRPRSEAARHKTRPTGRLTQAHSGAHQGHIACVKPNQDALVRREAARLRVQEEARRMAEAERFTHAAGPQPGQRSALSAATSRSYTEP